MQSSTPSKPLPPLPTSERGLLDVHRLSETSSKHLALTLRYALQAEALDQSWAPLIIAALDELADSVARGKWIHGLKVVRSAAATRATDIERQRRNAAREARLKPVVEDPKTAKPVPPEKDTAADDRRRKARDELTKLTAASNVPAPIGTPKHLLLLVAPLGPVAPSEDMDFDLVPSSRTCTFARGSFLIPAHNARNPDTAGHFLYGLDDWNPDAVARLAADGRAVRLVGGTFKFAGVSSPDIYLSLVKVLQTAIYVRLSLLLEERLLAGLHVPLQFPKPPTPPQSPALPEVDAASSRPSSPPVPVSPASTKRLARATAGLRSAASSGIWSFISKRTESLLHGHRQSLSIRTGYSLDGYASPKRRSVDLSAAQRSERWSEDDGAEGIETLRSPSGAAPLQLAGRFSSALKHLEDIISVLSTSPDMDIPPPPLLTRLAAREQANSRAGRRKPRLLLTGDERTALDDLRGWNEGDPFIFDQAFSGFQQFTALYSEHVPLPPQVFDANTSLGITRCGSQKWVTHRFWAAPHPSGDGGDDTLGGSIERSCELANEPCDLCDVPRKLHTRTWNHGSVKITLTIAPITGKPVPETQMWESCAVCLARNPTLPLDDGIYLYSFGKFLELLAYSKTMRSIPLALCQHTSVQPSSDGQTAVASQHNILRHFARNEMVVTFATAAVVDVYDIKVPKMQIVHDRDAGRRDADITITQIDLLPEQEAVRAEIRKWWDGLRVHLQELTDYFDEELDSLEERQAATPGQAINSSGTPPSTAPVTASDSDTSLANSTTLQILSEASQSVDSATLKSLSSITSDQDVSTRSASMTASTLRGSRGRLQDIRRSFERTEQELYSMLRTTQVSSLNDVRRAFASSARGIIKRLAAWQAKHAPAAVAFDKIKASEPEWWKSGCYAVPNGRVIVRDGEWGSIISCALSSSDYTDELANMQAGRPGMVHAPSDAGHESRPATPASSAGSNNAPAPAKQRKVPVNKPLPDPDDETARESWHEPEPYQTTTSRIDHARDVSSLLALRDVLRHKRSVDSSATSPGSVSGLGSRFSSLGSSASRFITSISAPPSAWAKPTMDISQGHAEGKVAAPSSGTSESDAESALLKVVEEQLMTNGLATTEDDSNALHGSSFVSVQSPTSPLSTVYPPTPTGYPPTPTGYPPIPTGYPPAPRHEKDSSTATIGPPVPPKDPTPLPTPTVEVTAADVDEAMAKHAKSKEAAATQLSLTSTLANAMRYVLSTGSGGIETPSSSRRGIMHPLLSAGGIFGQDVEDVAQPHIKYEFVLGSRLKFSCTVYYAKQFDELRRRCGISEDMLQSLARSAGWNAAGGKSKANFWKTADDRFVIKSLVNAWNVADLQVLNETAPAYFKYLDDSANRSSVIAKLLGYFTVEIKNLETGTTQAKADLLVMENLFHDHKIARTFDLKGIQGRKVKAKAAKDKEEANAPPRTLFDGEWIEGQQRALVLLQPHSKRVLQEAVTSDADFLARSNIMDYSLLLGIDEERKEIACGLVDTIGSYSFAKTLEYKAKQGLNNNLITSSQKEVTVIPPAEYRDRFVKAIDSYFLACPNKWTKLKDSDSESSSPRLYSVL